jgi:hypothetical protein
MIWTDMNLYVIKKNSCKYNIFWPSGSWGNIFLNKLTLLLAFLLLSSPFKRTWPLICKILNSLYQRMICT